MKTSKMITMRTTRHPVKTSTNCRNASPIRTEAKWETHFVTFHLKYPITITIERQTLRAIPRRPVRLVCTVPVPFRWIVPSPPPTAADFCEFFQASGKITKELGDLTLTDKEQRELYEAAKVIQKAYRSYKGMF